MNKVTISTLCWKRPDVFEMFCRNITSLNPRPQIVVAGSEGDQCEAIAKKYGCIYFQTQNKLLGKKANESVKKALETDCDYIMLTGSDDLISQSQWEYYCKYKGEYLGLLDYYFFNIPDGRMIYWAGYKFKPRIGEPIGAGKLIKKDVAQLMEGLLFSEKSLQPDEHDTHKKAIEMGVKMDLVTCKETKGIGIDIKGEGSITRFALWNNAQYIIPSNTLEQYPELESLIKEYSLAYREKENRRLSEKIKLRRNR